MIDSSVPAVCKCAPAGAPAVEKLGGRYRYKISDSSLDCEKEQILVTAWTKLGRYPVRVNHQLPEVGNAEVFIRDGALVADIEITDSDTGTRVDSGELGMASVGFDRIEFRKFDDGRVVTTKAELREVSLVPEGCNFSAHREKYKMNAEMIEAMKALMLEPCSKIEKLSEKLSTIDLKELLSTVTALAVGQDELKKAVVAHQEEIVTRDQKIAELTDKAVATAALHAKDLSDFKVLHDATCMERDEYKRKLDEKAVAPDELPITEPPPEPEPAPVKVLQLRADDVRDAVKFGLRKLTAEAINYHTGRLL